MDVNPAKIVTAANFTVSFRSKLSSGWWWWCEVEITNNTIATSSHLLQQHAPVAISANLCSQRWGSRSGPRGWRDCALWSGSWWLPIMMPRSWPSWRRKRPLPKRPRSSSRRDAVTLSLWVSSFFSLLQNRFVLSSKYRWIYCSTMKQVPACLCGSETQCLCLGFS